MRIKTHPGEILREEFMKPLNISQNKLARDLDIAVSRVSGIVRENRDVTADTAIRLAAYLQITPEFWMNLQSAYTLSRTQKEDGEKIIKSIRPLETV